MTSRAPFGRIVSSGVVPPEWIDINGHMNVAYYVLAFDLGVDALFRTAGITGDYIRSGCGTTFAVETHVTYIRELTQGQAYRVASLILAFDAKRVHQFQHLYRAEDNELAATAEWMNLHIDLGTRRVSPWPQSVLQALGTIAAAQAGSELPQQAGKRMRIAEPLYDLRTGTRGG